MLKSDSAVKPINQSILTYEGKNDERGKHETEKKKITFSRMGSERWRESDTQPERESEN